MTFKGLFQPRLFCDSLILLRKSCLSLIAPSKFKHSLQQPVCNNFPFTEGLENPCGSWCLLRHSIRYCCARYSSCTLTRDAPTSQCYLEISDMLLEICLMHLIPLQFVFPSKLSQDNPISSVFSTLYCLVVLKAQKNEVVTWQVNFYFPFVWKLVGFFTQQS